MYFVQKTIIFKGGSILKVDTLIVNADLFTMQGDGVGYIDAGAVAIDRGKIISVGNTKDLMNEFEADETIDATNKMVLPGFIDAHMHTNLSIIRGLAQDTRKWMHKGIGPFSSFITNEYANPASKMNILEGLASGTTTFGDYGSNMDEVASFINNLGARGRLTTTIREVPDVLDELEEEDLYPFEKAIGENTLNANLDLIERWHGRDNNRITTMLGPQAPDFLSTDLLMKIKEIAVEKDLKIHMHTTQAARETKQMIGRYNKRTIQYLDELDYLDERLVAVHMTDATDEEARILAKSGASMTLCSGSIGIIRGEVPPVKPFLEAGGLSALGSDQAPGNNCNQIINEMKLTALFNKIKYDDPEVMPAWKVLRMATIEGAQAFGIGDEVGSIEKDKKADIIFVDLSSKAMVPVIKTPLRNHVPNLVYSARGEEVCQVMVDGKTLYLNGKFLTVNEDEIVSEAQKSADILTSNIAEEDIKITKGLEYMKVGKL